MSSSARERPDLRGRNHHVRGAASVNGLTQDGNRADLEAANRARNRSRDTNVDGLKVDVTDRDVDQTVLRLGGGARRAATPAMTTPPATTETTILCVLLIMSGAYLPD